MSATIKKKLLIIDDDKTFRFMLSKILSAENKYEIREARNGLEAEQILTEFKADLIIMDIIMPGKSGLETCDLIRNNPMIQEPKIIGVSADKDSVNNVSLQDYGIDLFLEKPFNLKDFKQKLAELLAEEGES